MPGFLAKLIGKTMAGDGSGISKVIESVDDAFVGRRELEDKALDYAFEEMKGQVEINKIEAQHSSIFVAGWRPAIGWIGALALFYNFFLRPLMEWLMAIYNPDVIPPPDLDTGPLYTIITAMLGVAGLRTYEKYKNVDTKETRGLFKRRK